ncbi:MAG: ABC transporter permease [Desulfuromonadaceae bacterium]|nr:ABC transporter permease [Desulfuromonadaceae bacterium]
MAGLWWELLVLAWKNLWRNRRRTLITLAAMSLTLMLIQVLNNLSMGSYRQMIQSGVRAGSGHLTLNAPGYREQQDIALAFDVTPFWACIEQQPEVQQALPRLYLPGLAQSGYDSRGILLQGIDMTREAGSNPFLKSLSCDHWLRPDVPEDALLGIQLADQLHLKAGNKFVVTLQNSRNELVSELFRVRGVLQTGLQDVDQSLVLVSLERAGLLAALPGKIHELAILLQEQQQVGAVYQQLHEALRDQPGIELLTWQQAMPNLYHAIQLDYASQNAILLIMLVIVVIGIANTLLMSVMERSHEFGLILALGARPFRLVELVVAEALVLGALAAVCGAVLGGLGTWYLWARGIDLRQFISEEIEYGGIVFEPVLRAVWDVPWMAQSALFLVVLSVMASVYPALRAARLTPVAAMRRR